MKKKNWLILAMAFGLVAPTYASEKVVATTNIVEGVPTKATVVSCQMRATDPTVLDVVYNVESKDPFVKVRALAFKDGKRDFGHVIRPETWVDGTETNLGDHIAANVNHKLSWKVTADWQTDVGNLSFEVLSLSAATNVFVFPYLVRREVRTGEMYYTIKTPQIFAHYWKAFEGDRSEDDNALLSALLWFFADKDKSLTLLSGALYWDELQLIDGASLDVVYVGWPGWDYSFDESNDEEHYFSEGSLYFSRRKATVKYIRNKFSQFLDVPWKISPVKWVDGMLP